MAAIRHWPLYQQPPSFVFQGESGLICKLRLRRSLYGLKQCQGAWFGKFSSVIQAFGLKRSEADDHSVFYCRVHLMVYVDDNSHHW